MYGLKAHTLRFRVRYLGFDILRFAAKNRNKFDLAIDYEQFVRLSAIAGRMVDPSFFIGLCTKNSKKQAAYDLAIDYAEKNHVVEEFYDPVRRIAKMSGKKIDEKPSLFPPVFKESFLAKSSIKKIKALPIIGVCPGGRADDAERRYPKEKIAEALNKISEKKKVSFAFFGSKSEQEDIRFIISLMKDKKNCHDFSGLKLQDSAALISKTKIFISNDTGPLHLAASLGIFCVGLFGPSKEWIYGPYTDKRIILRDKKHKPIRSNHNEKNTGWPIEWWPEPELVADSVISTLEKSRLRK
jgi:ADP-heptose:LPS heptosyltransferase